MTGFIGKANDFVLDTRTVPRADPFNVTAVHGTFFKVFTDNLVSALVGIGDMTMHLCRVIFSTTHLRHHRARIVSGLIFQLRVIYGASINAGWCACFEASNPKWQGPESLGQGIRGSIAGPPPGVLFVPYVDFSTQKRSGGQHHTGRSKDQTHLGFTTDHFVAFDH